MQSHIHIFHIQLHEYYIVTYYKVTHTNYFIVTLIFTQSHTSIMYPQILHTARHILYTQTHTHIYIIYTTSHIL